MRKRSLRGVGRYRFSALCGRSAFAWRGKRKANAPFDAQDKEAQRTPRFAEKIGEVAHCFVARTAKNGCPTGAVLRRPSGAQGFNYGLRPSTACWAKFFGSPPGFGCLVIRAPDIRALRHWRQH